MRCISFGFLFAFLSFIGQQAIPAEPAAKNASPLELKLTALRVNYVLSPVKASDEKSRHVPGVVIEVELRNTGKSAVDIVGTPEPELVLAGPTEDSVRRVHQEHFHSPFLPNEPRVLQVAAFTLGAGESKRFSFCSLRHRTESAERQHFWTEAGEYKLNAAWQLAVSPAPEGSAALDPQQPWQAGLVKSGAKHGIVKLATTPVKIAVKSGDEIAYWAKELSDRNIQVRLAAAKNLNVRWPLAVAAVKELTSALSDDNKAIRRSAASTLGHVGIKAEQATSALRKALLDREADVRMAAATALSHVAPKNLQVAHDILPLIKESAPEMRRTCIDALAHMAYEGLPADAAIIAAVRAALKDADNLVRFKAIICIGYFRHPDTVLDLIGLLRPEHKEVRHNALHTLGNMGRIAKAAVPEMIQILKSDPEHREMTAWALACIGPDAAAAVPALIDCLNDPKEAIRNQSIRALRDIGPNAAEAVEALTDRLQNDKDWSIRQYAAEALGAIGPGARKAAPDLANALQDQMVQVRNAAAQAIGKIGPGAKAALPQLLLTLRKDPDSQARWLAAQSIGQLGAKDKKTIAVLIEALGDQGENVMPQTAYTLAQFGRDAGDAIPHLMKIAKTAKEGSAEHRAAVNALEKIQQQ